MAHPDDPELACGGTIAQWSRNDRVYYIIITSGDKGTWKSTDSPFATAHRREEEAKKAARFLKIEKIIFLRHCDGMVANIPTLKLELAALIRHLKPYTIVSHDPWRRQFHPDHRATGFAVIDAVMIARDWHFYPALAEVGLKPHRAKELLLAPSDNPNHFNDIGKTLYKKIKAIAKHGSQLSYLHQWKRRITLRAADEGSKSHFQYAEGFFKMRI